MVQGRQLRARWTPTVSQQPADVHHWRQPIVAKQTSFIRQQQEQIAIQRHVAQETAASLGYSARESVSAFGIFVVGVRVLRLALQQAVVDQEPAGEACTEVLDAVGQQRALLLGVQRQRAQREVLRRLLEPNAAGNQLMTQHSNHEDHTKRTEA